MRMPQLTHSPTVAALATALLMLAGAFTGATAAYGATTASAGTCRGWTGQQPPSPGVHTEVAGLAVLSACSVWAVGQTRSTISTGTDRTFVAHWTGGSSWMRVPSPSPGSMGDDLHAVAAVSARDIWTVGLKVGKGPFTALIEHWNGTRWTVIPSPTPPGNNGAELNGVDAVSANNIWAVGDYFLTNSISTNALIEHWNGTRWSLVRTPNPGSAFRELHGVTAVSAHNVWAVGNYVAGSTAHTFTEHWNGTRWAQVPSPNPAGGGQLLGVSARSGTDVWAVGDKGTSDPNVPQGTLVEHWNGTKWTVVASPSPGPAAQSTLTSVTATSDGTVWVVGVSGGESLLMRRNGSGWTQLEVSAAPDFSFLTAVAAASGGNTWIAGIAPDGHSAFAEPVAGVPQAEIAANAAGQPLAEAGLINGTPKGASKVAAKTSPSIAAQSDGSFEEVWQGTDDHLWTADSSGHVTRLSVQVATGTSPSIAALGGDSYVIAFTNAADGNLWQITSGQPPQQVGRGRAAARGTSPSVAGDASGGYTIAYSAKGSHDLVTINSSGGLVEVLVPVETGTSPAITEVAPGQFATVFVSAADLTLQELPPDGLTVSPFPGGLTVAPGTSPAVAASPNGLSAAVQVPGGHLWFVATDGNAHDTGQAMASGTSPAMASLPGDGPFEFAYQAARTHHLTALINGLTQDTGITMSTGTSPAIAAP
jgi:hypothetical protein